MVKRKTGRGAGGASRARDLSSTKGPKLRKRDRLGTEIGERIARARRGANLATITSLHKRTIEVDPDKKGISQPVLLGYEAGEYRPGAREMKLLSLALNVSPTWLLFGQENVVDKDAPAGAPSRLTFAKLIELTDEEKRGALLGMLVSYMTREERDAWINVIELFLRARLGDKQFELRQSALQAVTELLAGPKGISEHMGKLIESTLTPDQLANMEQTIKRRAAELGIPVEDPTKQRPE